MSLDRFRGQFFGAPSLTIEDGQTGAFVCPAWQDGQGGPLTVCLVLLCTVVWITRTLLTACAVQLPLESDGEQRARGSATTL